MDVWVTHVGNYFPREVTGVYATEALADAAAKDGESIECWPVITDLGSDVPVPAPTPPPAPAPEPLAHLSAAPLAATPSREVEQFVETINGLLDDPTYRFASDTLTGIRQTVQALNKVTEGQRRAVTNIEAGGQRGAERGGWSRRYEGR